MKAGKIKIECLLFYISYFLFLLYAFFGTIDIFKSPLKMLTNLSMIIILFVFILQLKNYKYNELIKIIICLLISFIFVIVSDNFLLLKLILIIIVSKNVEFEKRISFDIKLRIIFLLIMIVFYNLGIAEDTIALYNGKIRHSLGFSNPNVFGMHILILLLELLYLNKDNLSIYKMLFYTIIMFASNTYSGSRTALYLYGLSIVLFLLYKYKQEIFNNKFVKKMIIYSPLITTLVVYILYVLYINNTTLGIEFDKILSGRLFNIRFFSNNYNINLLGNNIALANKSCDTAIVYMLYAFGIVGAFLYVIGFQKLLKKLYKLQNLALVILIYVLVIYGISEKLWLFVDCNIIITAIGYVIYDYMRSDFNGK